MYGISGSVFQSKFYSFSVSFLCNLILLGKGIPVVSHIDDSPRCAVNENNDNNPNQNVNGVNNSNNNKRDRNRSIFSTPMLNKHNKARSSPALVFNNSNFNSARSSQKSGLSIGSDDSSDDSRKIPTFMRSWKNSNNSNSSANISMKNNKVVPMSQTSLSPKNNASSQQSSPKNNINLYTNKDFGCITTADKDVVSNYYNNSSRDSGNLSQRQDKHFSSNLPSPGGPAACGGFLSPSMTGMYSVVIHRTFY